MNNFVIIGAGRRADFINLMATFYATYLKLRTRKTISIQLHKNVIKASGGAGLTSVRDDLIIVIIDSSLKQDALIRTLAHEMVHVKQLADGRLVFPNIWLGKKVKAAYLKCPWEIEALSKQELMARHFLEFASKLFNGDII